MIEIAIGNFIQQIVVCNLLLIFYDNKIMENNTCAGKMILSGQIYDVISTLSRV